MKHPDSLISNTADAELRLKVEASIIGSISDFTFRWAFNNGLDETNCNRLSLSVTEIITDIVRFAYPEHTSTGDLEIQFLRHPGNLEILIHEWGEPFDPDRHVYDLKAVWEHHDFEGAGLRLIKFLTDEFNFINKGSRGKIYRLVKYLITKSEHSLPLNEPETEQAKLGEINFDIKAITTDDAEDVAKLIYRCYGHTYPKEELYHPKKIEQSVVRQQKIGVIARTDDGIPAGYFAVLDTTDSNVGEVGEAVVAPPYRRRGLFKRMMRALIRNAEAGGLDGLYGKAIALHQFSQRVNNEFGYCTTGILLADFPAVNLKNIDSNISQPVSEIIDFLPLRPLIDRTVYLPERYAVILKKCYKNLEVYNLNQAKHEVESTRVCTLDSKIDFKEKSGLIVIRELSRNFEDSLLEKVRALAKHNLNVIYLDIPLMRGNIDSVVEFLHENGFIFSGLFPLYHNNEDYLRMQRLYCNLDLSEIVTYSPMSTNIKQLLEKELI